MKIKTTELKGAALDYAVHVALGNSTASCAYWLERYSRDYCERYSTNWAQGGPIIERREIGIKINLPCSEGRQWEARPSSSAKGAEGKYGYGKTPLEAAMRCYVASELSNEIEIPEELV